MQAIFKYLLWTWSLSQMFWSKQKPQKCFSSISLFRKIRILEMVTILMMSRILWQRMPIKWAYQFEICKFRRKGHCNFYVLFTYTGNWTQKFEIKINYHIIKFILSIFMVSIITCLKTLKKGISQKTVVHMYSNILYLCNGSPKDDVIETGPGYN